MSLLATCKLLLLLLLLSLQECQASPTPESSCLDHGFNEELNVKDVFEVDVDVDIVRKIRADVYDAEVRPSLETGASTENFCLTTPYNEDTSIWDEGDGHRERSDMKWYSPRNKGTYDKLVSYVDALGLKELVRGRLVETDEVVVYNVLFLVRSCSEKHHFHLDWSDKLGTNSMTWLIPLNNFSIHMKYYDKDDEKRRYEYKWGKAVGFGGGFWHTTEKGRGEEEDVLLCVYLGGNDPKLWPYVLDNIGDESGYYMDPFKGFVKNENVPKDKNICL